jgi:hypothetical protein
MQQREYAVRGSIWLLAKNTRTRRPLMKLGYKYYGPFPLYERISKQAYKLRRGDLVSQIHQVFHVPLLEPCPPTTQVNVEEIEAQLKVENNE